MKSLLLVMLSFVASLNASRAFAQASELGEEQYQLIMAEENKAIADKRPYTELSQKTLNYKLSVAVRNTNARAIKDLLIAKADVNFVNPLYGKSILERVVKTGFAPLVEIVLAYQPLLPENILDQVPFETCKVKPTKFALIFSSNIANCDMVMQQLVIAGANLNNSKSGSIWKFYREASADVLLPILPRVDLNQPLRDAYSTPFTVMLRNNDIDTLLEPLLKHGGRFDLVNPISHSKECGLRNFWNWSTNMKTDEKVRRLKLFISTKQADINCRNESKENIVFDVIIARSVEGLRAVLEAGADVRQKNDQGYTPMTFARKILNKNRDESYSQIRQLLTDAQKSQR